MTIFQSIFGNKRIVGYAGNRNVGKTNNLVDIVIKFRKENKDTPIYLFGFDKTTEDFLVNLGNVYILSELKQAVGKSNAIFIFDEIQKLKLTDRRYKDVVDSFVDLIYHPENNNYVILCSPNLREFNSVIGNKIDKWLVKSIRFSDLVHGSPLKKAVEGYKGRFKQLDDLVIPFNQILILGEDTEKVLTLDYVAEADTKKNLQDVLGGSVVKQIVTELSQQKSEGIPKLVQIKPIKIKEKEDDKTSP